MKILVFAASSSSKSINKQLINYATSLLAGLKEHSPVKSPTLFGSYAKSPPVEEGDLIRGDAIIFETMDDVQIVIIHTE